MIARIMTLAAMLTVAPAASATPAADGETSVPRMSRFLEWRPDGNQALYIRADTGRWYHATLQNACPRLVNRAAVRFVSSPGDRFDRNSAVNADGWRCLVASVTASDGPPGGR